MVGIFIRLGRSVGLGVYLGVMAWLVGGVFVVVVSIYIILIILIQMESV